MHTLYIMRHGQAHSTAATDAQRPLTDLGMQQALEAAVEHLSFVEFDYVIVSPYLRAQQTWAQVQKAEVTAKQIETAEWITPDVPTQPALDELIKLSGDNLNVLLVCHQTFAGRLATHLVDGETHGRHVDVAGVVKIETEVFASQCGTLVGDLEV
jgi:phosphohistidine phosphatase